MKKISLIVLGVLMAFSISAARQKHATMVKIETSLGDIKVKLYDETPIHRDNFLKLVNDKFYDGTLFHRIIKGFMIQGGDPYSKLNDPELTLGTGGLGTTLPAEFRLPQCYHKRGALAAARQSDMVNPERESSSCQFYIVEGKTFTDAQLDTLEMRIQMALRMSEPYKFTDEQRKVYKTFGGTPHLDGQYTVFGEIVEGYDVLQKIAAVPTGKADRPKEDVKIISAKVVKK